MSMSYANMIENRKLKKTFVTAITVSAILSCLTSAQSIHEHIKLNRQEKARKKHDEEQDKSIKRLQKDVEQTKGGATPKDSNQQQLARDFEDRMASSMRTIEREYNHGFTHGGHQFAEGDAVTQVLLQQQVIALQQSVILMLQSLDARGQAPSANDYAKIVEAAERAKVGSIDALRGQSQRLLEPLRPMSPLHSPTTPYQSNTHDYANRRPPSPRHVTLYASPTKHTDDHHAPLYCDYSRELQRRPEKPLSSSFSPGGRSRCPSCDSYFDIQHGRAWRVMKDLPVTAGRRDRAGVLRFEPALLHPTFKEFHVLNRFIIKCHRENADFACVLCSHTRPVDTIWSNMDDLVRHVQRAHTIEEYELDGDIREVA